MIGFSPKSRSEIEGYQIHSRQSRLIHTWLEPGEPRPAGIWKPFKRFPILLIVHHPAEAG